TTIPVARDVRLRDPTISRTSDTTPGTITNNPASGISQERMCVQVTSRLLALLRSRLHRPLVIAEIDILLWRRRLGVRLALDLCAQRQHVAKTFLAELRVGREAEAGVDQLRIGALGRGLGELELVAQQREAFGLVGRVAHEAQ